MPREKRPLVQLTCRWCLKSFSVPYKRRHKQTCSDVCKGHVIAVKRSEESYRRAGKAGGKRSGQARRARAVQNFLTCMQGPMKAFGTSLYLLGFMHGQNTVLTRMRRARRG